jgi:hypothetical protein
MRMMENEELLLLLLYVYMCVRSSTVDQWIYRRNTSDMTDGSE